MIKKLMFIAALILTTHVQANCNQVEIDAGNQSAMNECAADDYKKTDAELNSIYKKLVTQIQSSPDSKLTKKKYLNALLKSQRAWLTYRDTRCNFETMPELGGSIDVLLHTSCLQSLTEERTKQLTCKPEIIDPLITCVQAMTYSQ